MVSKIDKRTERDTRVSFTLYSETTHIPARVSDKLNSINYHYSQTILFILIKKTNTICMHLTFEQNHSEKLIGMSVVLMCFFK